MKTAKHRKCTPEEILESHRKSHIASALNTIAHMRKLIDSVENCLTQSEGFPIYMTDLCEMATGLTLLAAAHGAVANAKHDVSRRQDVYPLTRMPRR